MKSFKYSLQAVRTLREQQEQAALQNYGRALRAAEQATEKLIAVKEEQDAAWAELQNLFAEPSTVEELARVQAYSHAVELRRLECERHVEAAHRIVRECFQKLVAARQAAAVLNKHFENQKRQHQRQLRRHEQKILDDLAGRQNLLRALPSETLAPLELI
jgi:flagellar export protein FliJ